MQAPNLPELRPETLSLEEKGVLSSSGSGRGARGGRGGRSKPHSLLHEFIRCIQG